VFGSKDMGGDIMRVEEEKMGADYENIYKDQGDEGTRTSSEQNLTQGARGIARSNINETMLEKRTSKLFIPCLLRPEQ